MNYPKWHVNDTGICDENGTHVCDVIGYGKTEKQNEQNRRFISLCPEIFSCLEKSIPWLLKAYEEKLHLKCAMPNALLAVLKQYDDIIDALTKESGCL